MTRITTDTVEQVADLSKLILSDEELAGFQEQLDKIIGYFEVLNSLDTTGVEPLAHPLDLRNVFRQDTVEDSAPREDALANAPDKTDEAYKVPVVIESS